jgi:hypothetical protein
MPGYCVFCGRECDLIRGFIINRGRFGNDQCLEAFACYEHGDRAAAAIITLRRLRYTILTDAELEYAIRWMDAGAPTDASALAAVGAPAGASASLEEQA